MITDKTRQVKQTIALALLKLMPEHKWDEITYELLSKESNLTIEEITNYVPSLIEIADATVDMIDQEVAEHYENDEESELSDRLFDLFMTRFEILQKYRDGIIALGSDARQIPELALQFYRAQKTSIHSMGVLLKVPNHKLNTAEIHLLLLAYQYSYMVWEKDKTVDLAPTMSALNTSLLQLKKLNIFAALR